MLLLMAVAGAVFGMSFALATMTTSPPVDSMGNTPSVAANLTQQNVTAVANIAPTTGVFVAFMAVAVLLAIVIVYFANVYRRAGRL